MEIIRGSLDDISRPASREQTRSRVSSVSLPHSDRICSSTPFSLLVLTSDAADIQIQSSSEESINSSARDPDKDQCQFDVTDEEKEEDIKLQRAIEEMRRLDEILSEKICREKEVRRQRKELQAKLWQELLQNRPECHSECAHEALNTKLFLALEAPTGTEEEDDFVPVFETQVPDCDSQYMEKSEKRPNSLTESFEVSHEETGEEQFEGSHCGASKGKKKQKDFVKRNIELVSGEGDQVLLTQAEKERLAELLQEVDEEEEDSARGTGSEEDMWAVSVMTGQGYTPEPSDLEQLIHIDSKIRLLLPVEEFHSVQSSYTNLSLSQEMYLRMRLHERIQLLYLANHTTHVTHIGTEKKLQATNLDGSLHCLTKGRGSEVGWKCDGDPQPGEKVLQDIKERRGQERRLQEIQQQLEILGQGQEMTDESPDLTEEQLVGLLDECELTESWTQDLEANDTTPWDPKKDFLGPIHLKACNQKMHNSWDVTLRL